MTSPSPPTQPTLANGYFEQMTLCPVKLMQVFLLSAGALAFPSLLQVPSILPAMARDPSGELCRGGDKYSPPSTVDDSCLTYTCRNDDHWSLRLSRFSFYFPALLSPFYTFISLFIVKRADDNPRLG